MTKLVVKFQTGGNMQNSTMSGAMQGFQQGGMYGMIAQGVGGFANKFPTPNADLNSNTQMAAQVRDGVSNALLSSGNPWAMAAGATVKILDKTGSFGDASEGLGEGTDMLNTVASIALPGVGWFAPATDKYKMSADMKVMSNSYSGSVKDAQTAEKNAGAKFLFGRGKANSMIAKAQARDNAISDIKQAADADFQTARSMTQNKAMFNQYALLGGYNQSYARVGKFGLKLQRAQQLAIKFKEPSEIKEQKEVYVMKDGGEFFANLREEFIPTTEEQNNAFFSTLLTEEDIQKFQKGGKTKTSRRSDEDIIAYANTSEAPFMKRIHNSDTRNIPEPQKYWKDGIDSGKRSTHLLATGEADGKYYVYPEVQEENGELKWFEDGFKRALENNDVIEFPSEEEALWFSENYKKYYPQFFGAKEFKEGGQMNVIPEGSLHARLHHMENADNLTKKGIPVVDNEGNQQAEIENSEIIFTKEVTEKLEELYKKFKSDEYTNKEKEGFAIEAGKLLSKEIIENTDDRVGLLNNNENETLANN